LFLARTSPFIFIDFYGVGDGGRLPPRISLLSFP
jgi:hypothetical protein